MPGAPLQPAAHIVNAAAGLVNLSFDRKEDGEMLHRWMLANQKMLENRAA